MEKTRERHVGQDCANASNPYHQCSDYCSPGGASKPGYHGRSLVPNGVSTSKAEGKKVMEGASVDPRCPNASNPYHQCSGYCSTAGHPKPRFHGTNPVLNGASTSKVEGKKVVQGRNVDPRCPNASNPYHECAQYCNQRLTTTGSPKPRGGTKSDERKVAKMGTNRNVDPNCINASNPYHECAEYCSKRTHERDHVVARRLVPFANGSKEGVKMAERRDVHPKCVKASNPYHKCAEYCFQRINEATKLDHK